MQVNKVERVLYNIHSLAEAEIGKCVAEHKVQHYSNHKRVWFTGIFN